MSNLIYTDRAKPELARQHETLPVLHKMVIEKNKDKYLGKLKEDGQFTLSMRRYGYSENDVLALHLEYAFCGSSRTLPNPVKENYFGSEERVKIYNAIKEKISPEFADALAENMDYGMCGFIRLAAMYRTLDPKELEKDGKALICEEWEAYTKTDEYKAEAFDDGSLSAERRPLIAWANENAQRYGKHHMDLVDLIGTKYNLGGVKRTW
ncbi:hypothetical protein [Neisseria sicca]